MRIFYVYVVHTGQVQAFIIIFSSVSIQSVQKNRHFSRCWYLMVIRREAVNPSCFSSEQPMPIGEVMGGHK